MHIGPEVCVTVPCILCRLHQELQALRVQKDSKHRVGERLAAEQDKLFRKVAMQSRPSVLTCTGMLTLLSGCCTTLGCRRASVIAFVLQVDECDAEVRPAVDVDGQQACKPAQNVTEALVKIDGLLQSWRAAVQDTQVRVRVLA